MTDKLLAEWFWTDRWMGSTGFLLPMEARGLYREMLTQAWRRGGHLPNDPVALQRATGATRAEWSRCWPKVSRFWRVEGDYIVNDTQLEVMASARANSERASARGLKGALAMLKRRSRSAQAHPELNSSSAQAQLEHKPPSPSPSPFNGQVGSNARPRNELMDRTASEREALALCREIATAENVDGTEVIRAESMWKGRSYVNPSTMPDDRLLRTLINLRARAAKLHADPNSHMTPAQRRAADGE
jgi:uncharacterized protein YdaU (DUF1376 family)